MNPAERGEAIEHREVRIGPPPGYSFGVGGLPAWPYSRGTATRKMDGWTWVVLSPPAAGEAWYPDHRVIG